jgi:cytochrome bd ubiquinol oxidase subunit I
VFYSPAAFIEVTHVLASTYFAGSLIFAGYMALMLARTKDENKKQYYRKGLQVILAIAAIATFASLITGVLSIQTLAVIQPEKYAALEGNLYPQAYAPEIIGGVPANNSMNATTLVDYISIPDMQSIMLNFTASGTVPGLSSYPEEHVASADSAQHV